MRLVVRRERPHPGAQLSPFEESVGWRYKVFATNTTIGQLAFLEARHRAHARVEDRIRQAKDTGLSRLSSREFDINTTRLTAVAIAADQTAWPRLLALREQPQRVSRVAVPAPCTRRRGLVRSGRRRQLQPPGPGPHRSSRPSPGSPRSRNRHDTAPPAHHQDFRDQQRSATRQCSTLAHPNPPKPPHRSLHPPPPNPMKDRGLTAEPDLASATR
jgi:hypothetical protein